MEVGKDDEVLLRLVGLDAGVLRDDSSTGTWSIEENSIKPSHNLWELSRIVVADNCVLDAETMDISNKTFGTGFVAIVGEYASRIFHQSCHVSSLSTWGGCHIENSLMFLWCKSHDWEEGGSGLKDVVTSEVFRCGS